MSFSKVIFKSTIAASVLFASIGAANASVEKCGYLGKNDNGVRYSFYEKGSNTHYYVTDKSRHYAAVYKKFQSFQNKHVCLTGNFAKDNYIIVDSIALNNAIQRKDITATRCEFFMDRIGASSNHYIDYPTNILKFVFKVSTQKLDGRMVSWGYFSNSYGQWREQKLAISSSSELNKYFALELPVSNKGFEAVFYLETDKGTRYWARAAVNGQLANFTLNSKTFDYLVDELGFDPDMYNVKRTAEFNRYFNPMSCR